MFQETSKTVNATDLSAPAETALAEFPTYVPNPNVDNGAFVRMNNGDPIVTFDVVNEQKILPNCVVEDPKRNRLLMLTHTQIAVPGAPGHGRDIYLFSAPWGHPEGPWTRLSAFGTPFIGRGADTTWDEGCVGNSHATIEGDIMYVAYVGHSDAANHGSGNWQVGLATFTLTGSEVNPVVTKEADNPLGLGAGSPHNGYSPKIFVVNGTFALFMQQAATGGTAPYNIIPRLWTTAAFSATDASWQRFTHITTFGTVSSDYDAHFGLAHLGGLRWWMPYLGNNYFIGYTLEYEDSQIHCPRQAKILALGAGGKFDSLGIDNPTPLCHNGEWYLFYSGRDAASGQEVGLAKYTQGSGMIDQTGVTITHKGKATGSDFGTTQNYRIVTLNITSYTTGGQSEASQTTWFKQLDRVGSVVASNAASYRVEAICTGLGSTAFTVKFMVYNRADGTEVAAATNVGNVYCRYSGRQT